ncbi:MAG: phospho-N-acetylmuramoyl-pentapeptide-transferase [Clostridiales bacterium]|nr:phospho-N-acetylmuramoyl-pentapeptide-transferase [Clostridiales bacterium]
MDKFFLVITIAFIISLIISPIVIKLAKKLKASQPVYEYVDMHNSKKGTPTMGGIIFLVGIIVTSILFLTSQNQLAVMCLGVFLSFGLVGFLDDFLKIKHKHNEGLKPYQKIFFQLAISLIVSFFAFNNGLIGSSIYLPFVSNQINLGYFYIPFTVIVFLAVTNSVNLTDGLDGLAGGVSLSYLISFTLIFFTIFTSLKNGGASLLLINEYNNLSIVLASSIGALLAYLLFNSFPARIFMGDTGSLALGGLIAAINIFTKQTLLIPILGIMFVVSSLSVILQVAKFKLTKKRMFLMAPFHHHLEKKGMHETKIVCVYIIITIIVGVVCELLQLILF